jgi:hypothetical protein
MVYYRSGFVENMYALIPLNLIRKLPKMQKTTINFLIEFYWSENHTVRSFTFPVTLVM